MEVGFRQSRHICTTYLHVIFRNPYDGSNNSRPPGRQSNCQHSATMKYTAAIILSGAGMFEDKRYGVTLPCCLLAGLVTEQCLLRKPLPYLLHPLPSTMAEGDAMPICVRVHAYVLTRAVLPSVATAMVSTTHYSSRQCTSLQHEVTLRMGRNRVKSLANLT